MNILAAALVAAASAAAFAVALIILCRAAEAADKNRADDLLSPVDEANFDLWEIEIGGQR